MLSFRLKKKLPNVPDATFKDKNRLGTDSSIIANTFNNYFINITNTLNLKPSMPKSKSLPDLLKLYDDHFRVLKIREKYKIQNKFQFKGVSLDAVRKMIEPLNKKNLQLALVFQ